ncbi:MAG: HNH endonuclease signature motif containing protein [Acidimicrobiales bacterium]
MATTTFTEAPVGAWAEPDYDVFPSERLEWEICSLSSQLAATTCRLLLAIAAYDRRQGWAQWECRSMAHWLCWKASMGAGTAREHVRVARALEDLPVLRAEFAAGRLSYSQVRAITRVATGPIESELVRLAQQMPANRLEKLVGTYRSVRAASLTSARAQHDKRGMTTWTDADGTGVIVLRLPAEDAALVVRAVEAEADAEYRRRHRQPEHGRLAQSCEPEPDEPVAARRADALVALVQRGGREAPTAGASAADRSMVIVHVTAEVLAGEDPEGLCHLEDGPAVAAETARRQACDGAVLTATVDPAGSPLDIGRRSRAIPPALRRALLIRDGGCRFPGCGSTVGTQGHHISHWAHGGPTKLDNLVTLCRFHHHRLHEGGYSVDTHTQPWTFRRPYGTAIDPSPPPPADPLDLPEDCRNVDPGACTPQWYGERVDYSWIIEGFQVAEGLLDFTKPAAPPAAPDGPNAAPLPPPDSDELFDWAGGDDNLVRYGYGEHAVTARVDDRYDESWAGDRYDRR